MKEMNHFNHKKHPLNLFENFEVIVAGGDNGIQGEVHCDGCFDPISSGSVYACISCRYFLHEKCAQLEPTLILHELHSLHPLTLKGANLNNPSFNWSCDLCNLKRVTGIYYYCSPCDFAFCVKCVVATTAQIVAVAALKKEAAVKFQHEGHDPEHTLSLQLRPASFYCNACKDEKKDFFYLCDNCDFWIHKTCASLELTIDLPHHHNHPLFLAYSLPQNFYNFAYFCELCNKRIMHSDWIYHCANCRYFIHIKCSFKADQFSTPRDVPELVDKGINDGDLLQFPMSEVFTDPLKILYLEKTTIHDDEKIEIMHWSHNHMLCLNKVYHTNNGCDDPIELCHGCVRPLSLPYYSCKAGSCSFTLHKYCAELPRKLEHPLHPDHSLYLINTREDWYCNRCVGCGSYCNTFLYKCETCKFYIDVSTQHHQT